MMAPAPFDALRMFGYDVILSDFAWRYEMRSAKGYAKAPEAHYKTMADQDILDLPVRELASGSCVYLMWCIWPRIDFALEVMKAHGFKYVTGGAWFKRTKNGKKRMGPGYALRTVCEPFLLGRIGDPQVRLTNVINAVGDGVEPCALEELGSMTLQAVAREHSRKPDEMRDILVRMTPHALRRVDLFTRAEWPAPDGVMHDVFGDEIGIFDGKKGSQYEPPGKRQDAVQHSSGLLL